MLLDEPHGGDGEDSLLERLHRAIAGAGVEPRGVDDEPEFRVLAPNSRDQPPALAAPNETGTSLGKMMLTTGLLPQARMHSKMLSLSRVT